PAIVRSRRGNLPAPNGRGLSGAVDYSDSVKLPGDIVGDPPEIPDVGLADECVGTPLMPPIQQVDVLAAVKGRGDIRLFRRPDDQTQRSYRLVVGSVNERRRGPAFLDHEAGSSKIETPRL